MKDFHEKTKLTIPNDVSYLSIVTAHVEEIAKKVGFSWENVKKIVLGVEEAAANVIKHAFASGQKRSFDIICERIPMGLKVIIKEKFTFKDSDKNPVPAADQEQMESAVEGLLGIFLMHEVMDDVSFYSTGSGERQVHLVKYLETKHIEELFPIFDIKQPQEEKPKSKKEQDINIRLMKLGEAIEVSKCVYRTYGYSYPYKHIFYPERIVELNRSGLLTSAVAVLPDGQVIGHAALFAKQEDSNLLELGMVVVDKEYRARGIAEQLFKFLIEKAKKHNILGIYAHVVTVHPYTQKVCFNIGMGDSGILLGFAPSTLVFRGISEELVQRETTLLMYSYMQKPEKRVIYPPKHHMDIIKKLYKDINDKPECKTVSKDKIGKDDSIVRISTSKDLGVAAIIVQEYGEDLIPRMQLKLRALCIKRIEVIELYLNLQDPATSFMVKEFEKIGFFFAGILPGEHFRDTLILQYLNNVEIDCEKIQLYPDIARELLGYIRKCNPKQLGC